MDIVDSVVMHPPPLDSGLLVFMTGIHSRGGPVCAVDDEIDPALSPRNDVSKPANVYNALTFKLGRRGVLLAGTGTNRIASL